MTAQDLKNSILQLAVQGKLVPQCKEDEPASELLKRIEEENARKIKLGIVKNFKALDAITTDDFPFDIPESWCWVKLGEICQLLDGEKRSNENFPYLEAKYLRGKVEANILNEGKYVSKDTRLILVDGENSGEVFSAIEDGYMGSTFKVLYIPDGLFEGYVLKFLAFKQEAFRNNKTGSAIPHLNKELFFNMPLPIPPLAEQKRIVAKIEELLPMVEEYGKAQEQLATLNAEFPDKLRKSILQQAVQGKLTERDPSDEPASELLKRIKAEKENLIKSGKIKKDKPLPAITDDEKPFDIPDTWEWVRLCSVTSVLGDGIHGTPNYDEKGSFYFINGNNLSAGNIAIKDDTKRVSKVEFDNYKKPLDENTILVSINGTIGNYAFYHDEPIILGKSACYFSMMGGISKDYISKLISSDYFMSYAVNEATKTTIKNVSLQSMRMFLIPLPPLAEQKRIVKRVDELLALCEGLK